MNRQQILDQFKFALMRPLHPRGLVWVGAAFVFLLFSWVFAWHTGGFWLTAAGLFYICFRNPVRVISAAVLLAPADGILTQRTTTPWPAEADRTDEAARITLQPRFYDVHALRAPIGGTVTHAVHAPGQWGSNLFDKTAPGHERAVIVIQSGGGETFALEVIAGGAAGRIKLYSAAGDVVTAGQVIAYANFGGEVRLYAPQETSIAPLPGQRMIAGETNL